MPIENVQLGTGATTITEAAILTTKAVVCILLCNNDPSPVTITLYAVPAGGSVGDGTTILKNYIIPGEDTYIWTSSEKFILGPEDKISGLASVAAKVTATSNYLIM